MRVLITGASFGIGRAAVSKFLDEGHEVFGIDLFSSTLEHPQYAHYLSDVRNRADLPPIPDVQILVNNAGTQTPSDISFMDIEVNLMGLMNTTEKYGIQENIKAIVNIASASAHTGSEFAAYAASKGGVLAYTKNTAMRIAHYHATCNSISPGGVLTDSNYHIMTDPKLMSQVLNETLLKSWATTEEIADWIYFVAVHNKSMTSQDVLIDNGESSKFNFIW